MGTAPSSTSTGARRCCRSAFGHRRCDAVWSDAVDRPAPVPQHRDFERSFVDDVRVAPAGAVVPSNARAPSGPGGIPVSLSRGGDGARATVPSSARSPSGPGGAWVTETACAAAGMGAARWKAARSRITIIPARVQTRLSVGKRMAVSSGSLWPTPFLRTGTPPKSAFIPTGPDVGPG
jgi:hypothetical protein